MSDKQFWEIKGWLALIFGLVILEGSAPEWFRTGTAALSLLFSFYAFFIAGRSKSETPRRTEGLIDGRA